MREHVVNTGFGIFAMDFTCTHCKMLSRVKQVLDLLLSLHGTKILAGTPKDMLQWFCGREDCSIQTSGEVNPGAPIQKPG